MKRYLTGVMCSTLLILVATLAAPALAELAAPTFDKDDSTISSMEALAKSIGTMDEEITVVRLANEPTAASLAYIN